MKKFTIYLGLNDRVTKKQEINTIDAFKIATNIFAKYTEGVTITEARGVYTHDNGDIVIENSLRCEVFDVSVEVIKTVIELLGVALNQEAVILEVAEVNTEFIKIK